MRLATKETETENLFEILANKSPVGICIIQDGRFCYTNPTFQSNTGYREDELLGRDSLDIVVPEDREMVRENAIKMLKGKLTPPYQFRVTHKDGSIHWVIESIASVRYRGRRATLGSFVDITERKQAEEALQAEKNKLQSLIDAVEYNLSIQDTEFNIIYQNEPSRIASGDHVGEKCYRAYEGREKVCDGCPVEEVFKDGKSHTAERRMVTPSGEVIFMESTATPIRDAGGKIVSCLEIVRNITERKRAEEAWREAEEEKSVLLEEAPVGIIHADLKGKITYVNKRFESESGYSREEITGKRGLQLDWFPAGTTKYLAKRMAARLKGSPAKHWETPFKCKDGRWIWIELEGKILRRLGVPVGFQIIARNITERKQAEEALQAEKNKLQSLIDSMEDTITIQDTQFNIIYQNEPSRIASGGDHIGEKCYRAYEGRESICENCPVEKAFKDGKSHTAERRTAISGKVAFWENTANPIRDAEGRVVSCLELARDVTERKKQEQALKDSEESYRELANSITDVFFAMDEHLRYTYWNRASEILTGTRAEDALGKALPEIFPDTPEIRKAQKVYRDVLRTQQSQTFVTDYTNPDGRHYILEISAYPSRGGISVFVRDITERKRAEEALQQSEEKYRALFDSTLIGTIVIDAETMKAVMANQAAAKMFAFRSPEEGIGQNLLDFVPPEDKDRVLEAIMKELFEQDLRTTREFRAITKDGREIWLSVTAAKIMHEGRLAGLISFTDITERKRAEEALQQSEEKYRALFDSTATGTIVIDAETMKVVMANQAAAKMFGLSSIEEGIGVNPLDFAPPEGRERVLELIVKELFEQDLQQTREFQMITKDGRAIWVSATAARIAHEGRLAGLVSITDVTERKQAEEALQAERNKLQSIIDAMEDDLTIQDTEYNIIFQNEPARISTGGDHVGEKCYRVYEGQESICEDCPVEKAFNDGNPHTSERQHPLPSGELSFWENTANPIRDARGKVVACLEIGRNITERKRAEEQLQESEQYLKTLFNASAGGILVIDPETHDIIDANSTVIKMIGIERNQIIGRMCHKFVCSAEVGKCPITDLGQKVDSSERILLKATGESMPIIKSVVTITRHGRQYLLELIVDITERKKQEQALADELTRRRLLVDQSLDGIVVLDVDARVVEANQRFADMLGYTLEDVRKLHTWDWDKKFPPEKILEMGRNVDEKGLHLETQHTRKDGSILDVDISINAAMFGEQKLIFCVCRDVTERKKMEEALKMAAEEWRKTFDSISDAISIHDKEFRILRANNAFTDLFHVKPGQVIGKHCYELHKLKKPKSGCPQKQTLATEKPAVTEFYESHLGKFLLESTSPIFNEKGEVVGIVHVTRDVTAQKQQNERLMKTDRLVSIGELAAGTAHELNNPLTSIIGFSQLLMEKDIPDDILEDVKLIYNEAQRAANVTKNLLTFARKHTPVKQLSQINNIIEDVLKLRAYELKVNDIEVKKRLAPDLPEIMVDYYQMQQVFLNIIINAEYFMTEAHKKGTLTITTKKQNGSTVRISIADDGPGIPQENLKRIFDPFFTTKEAGKGTGLGLSICHGIVAEHGGQIYARSQLGKGATIFVELPINGL